MPIKSDVKINGFDFIQVEENDPFNYCPIKDGIGPSSAAIPKLGKQTSKQFIEVDEMYIRYIRAKMQVRRQWGLERFYQTSPLLPSEIKTQASVHLARAICDGNHLSFTFDGKVFHNNKFEEGAAILTNGGVKPFFDTGSVTYTDFFDYLCMNVQEDVVLMTMINGVPTASIIHLHHPNGWSAEGAIGKSFDQIHEEVVHRNNKKVFPKGDKVVEALIRSGGTFERVGAISFRANCVLNRHPEIPLNDEFTEFNPENPKLWMRFERQTIIGLPEIDSFLFTIKTYFYDVFKPGREAHMINVFKNIHTDAYSRWWLDEKAQTVIDCLEKRL